MISFFIVTICFSNLLLLAFLFTLDVKKGSPAIILWTGLTIIYCVPAISDFAVQNYSGYEFGILKFRNQDVLIAQLYAFYILITFAFFRFFLDRWISPLLVIPRNKNHTLYFHEVLIYYFLLSILVYFIYSSYHELVSVGMGIGWVARRELINPVDAGVINLLLKLLSGFSLLWLLYKKKVNFLFLFLVFISAFIFLGGSRLPVIMFSLPVLAYWMMQGKSLLRFAVVSVSYFFISLILDFLRLIRFQGTLEGRLALILNPLDTVSSILDSERSELSLRYFYYSYVSGESYIESFFTLKYFFRSLMAPVPSFIAPFKPENFEYDMHLAASGLNATMHPTMFGSIYADSGYFGLVWVILIVFYIYIIPMLLKPKTKLSTFILFGVLATSSLMIARGAIYGSFVSIIAVAILIKIYESFSKKVK